MKKQLLILTLVSTLYSSTTEDLFWEEVRDSNSIYMLQLYKQKYPNGTFTIFADKKIEKLSGGKIKPTRKKSRFITAGKYSCKNFTLTLQQNRSAYYYKDGKKIKGVWSSNGKDAKLYFRDSYRKIIFNIKQNYGKLYIYKDGNLYCDIDKVTH